MMNIMEKQPNSIIEWSDKIFTHLLKLKEDNSDIRFLTRQMNTRNRLDQGYWFTGNEDYAFISIVKKGDSMNKTKTIGFVLTDDRNNNKFKLSIEVVYKAEENDKMIQFYKKFIDKVEGFEEKRDQSYVKHFSSNYSVIDNFDKYFVSTYHILLDLAKDMELEDELLIGDELFNDSIDKIKKIKESRESLDNKTNSYWVFQANPKHYRIIAALEDNVLNSWVVNAHRDKIKKGDKIIIRVGGENTGVYALATAISDVCKFVDEEPDSLYYVDGDTSSLRERVRLRLDHNLSNMPFGLEKMNSIDLNGGNAGTNFSANKEQYNAILGHVLSLKNNNPMKNQPLNQILYGPPGTGKTYNTINKAIEIINPSFDLKQSRDIVKTEYQRLVEEGQIVFTTFHQSMCYEDFIEGIKPQEPVGDDSNLTYKVDDGIFKIICKKAKYISGNLEKVIEEFKDEISEPNGKSPITIKGAGTTFDVIYRGTNVFYVYPHASTKVKPWYPVNIDNIFKSFETDDYTTVYNPTYIREILKYLVHNRGLQREENIDVEDKKFVLIIDEINRGNVSQIFGELITLIEEDKRLGCDEALEAILPYSKEKFSVPKNLHIIGTMNTADRSVEALDAALRRRFTFEEMPPKPILIKEEGKLKDHNGVLKGIDLVVLLELINKRIEKLLDKDHKIGHSYFMSVETMYDLKQTFQNKIIPLLQEYFYGDYGKIGLVLGAGFFNEDGKQDKEDIFAYFNVYDKSMLGRPVYSFKNLMELDGDEFNEVVNTLLGKPVSVEKKLSNEKINVQ
ncbi:MAG: AAA family ATPase [Marinifilaceae bacterium]